MEHDICRQCGTIIDAGDPSGLCARCGAAVEAAPVEPPAEREDEPMDEPENPIRTPQR